MKNSKAKKKRNVKNLKFTKKQQLTITISIVAAFVAVLVLLYFGTAQYFKTHFFSGSVINGINATGKTVEEVRKTINKELEEYTLDIIGRENTKDQIKGKDILLTYVDDNKLESLLKKQNPYLWFKGLLDDKEYTLAANTTYDKGLLKQLVEKSKLLEEVSMIAPQDAKIEVKNGTYEITKEVLGTTLQKDKLYTVVEQAIEKGETSVDLEKKDCYVNPSILSDNQELVAKKDVLNKYSSVNISITFGSRTEVVNGDVINEWIVENEQGDYVLDEEAVGKYVKSLAYKYDTFGLKRKFKTNAGNVIDIPAGGDYGWAMHRDKTTAQLLELIEQGGAQTMEPVYRFSAKSREEDDIGGTYVEISIQEQRMWCYKDGKVIVDTPIVTGNSSKLWDTPVGIYAIDAKKSPSVLKGEGYITDVTYWLPFNGNVGIHDADTWRPQYGGEIYKTQGSHGCVNTPTANAKIIYNTVDIGTAVVVY